MSSHDNHDYNKELKEFARENRKKPTRSENLIWQAVLKGRQTGYRCLRQRPILNFIADFYFPEVKLVLEIDGASHESAKQKRYDLYRDKKLLGEGYITLRLTDIDIFENLDAVDRYVKEALEKRREDLNLPVPMRKTRRS